MTAYSIRPLDSPLLFALATLGPVPLLLMAAWTGGPFVWAALAAMTVFVPLMDLALRALPPERQSEGSEFPAGTRLSIALWIVQWVLLLSAAASLGGAGADLSWPEAFGLFVAFGLWLGQIGNSNAHELIHRPDRRHFELGKWLFISLLFGHHTSAHRKIHHRYVASRFDPNTAALGESFYSYLIRAWAGAFVAGYDIERAMLAPTGPAAFWKHPYVTYLVGAALCLGLAGVIGGPVGVLWYLALALYAQMQLLLSDYVQHYGLVRAEPAPGKLEPVGPEHSWNAPQRWSGAMMLNAPRHSDHHAHPAKPFTELDLGSSADVPTLPYGLPIMACLALCPPLWRRMMDKRALRWRRKARQVAA